jgi:mono/diheme cytochrome c family protein
MLKISEAWLTVAMMSVCVGSAAAQDRAANPSTAAAPSAAAAEKGRPLFVKYGCSQCHGLEGQGAPTSGPRIGPNPIQLTGFLAYVRSPRGQKPPYTAKIVSDQDLADIRAFLTARPGPAAQVLLQPE